MTAKPYDAQGLVNIINKYKVHVTAIPPYMLLSLLQIENLEPLESIRFFSIGGSKVSDHLCTKFKSFLPNGIIATGYGSTEENNLTFNPMNRNFGCSGIVSNNVQLRVS